MSHSRSDKYIMDFDKQLDSLELSSDALFFHDK